MNKFLFCFRVKEDAKNIFRLPHEDACMLISFFMIVSGLVPLMLVYNVCDGFLFVPMQLILGFNLMCATINQNVKKAKVAYILSLIAIVVAIVYININVFVSRWFMVYLYGFEEKMIFLGVSSVVVLILVQFSLIIFMYYKELERNEKQSKAIPDESISEDKNNAVLEKSDTGVNTSSYSAISYNSNANLPINTIKNDFENVYRPPNFINYPTLN